MRTARWIFTALLCLGALSRFVHADTVYSIKKPTVRQLAAVECVQTSLNEVSNPEFCDDNVKECLARTITQCLLELDNAN